MTIAAFAFGSCTKALSIMEGCMNLIILGATGGTGLELVRRSLVRGHSVTAFVRDPNRLEEFRGRIAIKRGDLLNRDALAEVLQGQDAVLSGFGPRVPIAKADAHLLEEFAAVLTGAMKDASLRRAVIISTAFLFKDSIIPPTYLIGKLFFPTVVADSAALEGTFQKSDLDWTIVRPPQLTDTTFTGKFRVRLGHLPRMGFKIGRPDVAEYFVQAASDNAVIRKIVGVSY
jgi:putative NADH-flavin reductase